MSDTLPRRALLAGLAASPAALVTGAGLVAAERAGAAPFDPFPGYHREILGLFETLKTVDSDKASDALMARWKAIDDLMMASKPTTLAGVTACLEVIRREHVAFNMVGDEGSVDPGDRLILCLLDGALGVLRSA